MSSQGESTQTNKFELLRDKSILSILDGDVDFGTLKINRVYTQKGGVICSDILSPLTHPT